MKKIFEGTINNNAYKSARRIGTCLFKDQVVVMRIKNEGIDFFSMDGGRTIAIFVQSPKSLFDVYEVSEEITLDLEGCQTFFKILHKCARASNVSLTVERKNHIDYSLELRISQFDNPPLITYKRTIPVSDRADYQPNELVNPESVIQCDVTFLKDVLREVSKINPKVISLYHDGEDMGMKAESDYEDLQCSITSSANYSLENNIAEGDNKIELTLDPKLLSVILGKFRHPYKEISLRWSRKLPINIDFSGGDLKAMAFMAPIIESDRYE